MDKNEWETLKLNAPVRIQWGPERDLFFHPLPYRAIQIGLSKAAVEMYTGQWIQQITDVTPLAHSICELVKQNRLDQARQALPQEMPYPYE